MLETLMMKFGICGEENKVLNILEQTEGLGKEEFSRLKTYLLKLRKDNKHESRTNNT